MKKEEKNFSLIIDSLGNAKNITKNAEINAMHFEHEENIVTFINTISLLSQTQEKFNETEAYTYEQEDYYLQNSVPKFTNDSGIAALLISAVMAAYAIVEKSTQYCKKRISIFVKSRKKPNNKLEFVTRIAFTNVSNGHVFGKGNKVYSPLCIKKNTDSDAKINSYRVCYSSPEHIPNVNLSIRGDNLIISFDRLANMDGFILEIEHSNNFDKSFKIECEIFDCVLSRISLRRKHVIFLILGAVIILPLIVIYTVIILLRTVLFGAIIVALIAAEIFLLIGIIKERPPKKMRDITKFKKK